MPTRNATTRGEGALLERYRLVALAPVGHFDYPTGREDLRLLGYPEALTSRLAPEILDSFCGVGCVFAPGAPRVGQRVLDIGCGAGVDALLSAVAVGTQSVVRGGEFSTHMLARAAQCRAERRFVRYPLRAGPGGGLAFGQREL